jgi:hypothetical protein
MIKDLVAALGLNAGDLTLAMNAVLEMHFFSDEEKRRKHELVEKLEAIIEELEK